MSGANYGQFMLRGRRNGALIHVKPAAGYGSKAAYRGAKLTQRVWGGNASAPLILSCDPAQGIVDYRLGHFEHEAQVIRAPDAFGIDLVDVLGA